MDQLPPISTKTSRRSRYSLYQSDYETAGEESDNSLYYSMLDDDDNESDNKNKENSINHSNVKSTRRSLFAKCLENQLNHTPRNEFNKRVSINPLLQSTMSPAMTNEITIPAGISSVPKIDVSQELSSMIESQGNLSHSMTSLRLERPNSIESTEQVVDSENIAFNAEATNAAASDVIINDDNDQSLNNTIVAISDNQTGSTLESSTQAAETGIYKDTATATSHENPTALELASQSANNNISITFGLSNLSRKVTIIASSTSDSTNTHVCESNIPSNPGLLKYRVQSTVSCGISKPKGKTGIPRVSMIGPNMMGSSQDSKNSTVRTSILPIFSLKCKYCDKTFAKKSILDTHLLEKCEKIPATRHRQLVRSQSNSTNNY